MAMAHTGYYSDLSSFDNVDQALAQAELYRDQAAASATLADASADAAAVSESTTNANSAAALAAANGAVVSEANALTYSTNAANSAALSLSYKNLAETAKTGAEAAATAAALSQTEAGTSATAAAGSATAAATSATNAAASATTATTQATAAGTSATTATTQATNAATSATTATTQATNAGNSATAAAGSATTAGTAATTATTQAGIATTQAGLAASSAASVTGAAVPMFQVSWWGGNRAAIPSGYVAADGQTLGRATYPDAWTAINAGNMPTVSDATWLSTVGERGKYTVGNGSTTFRVPDYNGKSAGATSAPFLRGDGARTGGAPGVIRQDQFQNFAIQGTYINVGNALSGNSYSGNTSTAGGPGSSTITINALISDGTNGTPRTGIETRGTDIVGCFIIKLFGAVVNAGTIDASTLNTRVTALEAIGKPFQKEFVSTQQTISAAGTFTVAHGLGVKPKLVKGYLVCTVATGNWAVGDEVFANLDFEQNNASIVVFGYTLKRDATNVIVRFGSSGMFLHDPTTAAFVSSTTVASNFKFVMEAWA